MRFAAFQFRVEIGLGENVQCQRTKHVIIFVCMYIYMYLRMLTSLCAYMWMHMFVYVCMYLWWLDSLSIKNLENYLIFSLLPQMCLRPLLFPQVPNWSHFSSFVCWLRGFKEIKKSQMVFDTFSLIKWFIQMPYIESGSKPNNATKCTLLLPLFVWLIPKIWRLPQKFTKFSLVRQILLC